MIWGVRESFLYCVVSTKGIVSVLVALMAGKVEVKYHTDLLDAMAVLQLIEELGFGASLLEDDTVNQGKLDLMVRQIQRIVAWSGCSNPLPAPS